MSTGCYVEHRSALFTGLTRVRSLRGHLSRGCRGSRRRRRSASPRPWVPNAASWPMASPSCAWPIPGTVRRPLAGAMRAHSRLDTAAAQKGGAAPASGARWRSSWIAQLVARCSRCLTCRCELPAPLRARPARGSRTTVASLAQTMELVFAYELYEGLDYQTLSDSFHVIDTEVRPARRGGPRRGAVLTPRALSRGGVAGSAARLQLRGVQQRPQVRGKGKRSRRARSAPSHAPACIGRCATTCQRWLRRRRPRAAPSGRSRWVSRTRAASGRRAVTADALSGRPLRPCRVALH